MTPIRYPELTVAGDPRVLGRQIGDAARDQVRGFCEVALERVNKTMRVSRATADAAVARSTGFVEKWCPDLWEELQGTAEAAGVTERDLMLLQIRNQLTSDEDAGCTSLSVSEAPSQGPIVAQNWDNDPLLDEFTLVLTRRPSGRPANMTCTQAGLISYMGLSETGMGFCVNTLPAPARTAGVPHYFILRRMYEATSLDEVVAIMNSAERAIPVNIMMATPQGPANVEATVSDLRIQRPIDTHSVTHTNHCVHPDFAHINADFPELIQSHPRKRRIDSLLQSGERPDVQGIMETLRDHDGHPTSICRHANEHPEHGFWETVFSIVIEPSLRKMHIARGTPCEHPFETYHLTDQGLPA